MDCESQQEPIAAQGKSGKLLQAQERCTERFENISKNWLSVSDVVTRTWSDRYRF